MKKINKILSLILAVCMFSINIMPISASSYKLDIVKESADIKYLENDQGYISKKIISSNPENGEVTVELTVSNSKTSAEEVLDDPEIMLVIDSSGSMESLMPSGNTRIVETAYSVEKLVNSIYSINSNVKVGLVKFSSRSSVMQILTNNQTDVMNAITVLRNQGAYGGTNIAYGIESALNSFSNTTNNKIIILVTDGIPTGYLNSSLSTEEEMYSSTRSYLSSTAENTELITILTGVTNEEYVEDQEIVTQIFGTKENPTADKFYNIQDVDLNKTITEDILSDIQELIKPSIKNVTITDYFPDDIKDNFEFSYVTKPTTGTLSEGISDSNTITYTLDELAGNESVTIAYKLKLKDMNNKSLLDKVINTNEKVVLTYTDSSNKNYEVTLTSSPSIKLVKVAEKGETNLETTVENPSTGLYISIVMIVLTVFSGVFYIVCRRKNYFNKI